ncbi:MAG TPA: gfo/Idh/MocA family oxidoreductase, partial [Ginsengibacter sp.]
YLSAKTKKWEPILIEDWRGVAGKKETKQMTSYDEDHYLIKEEVLPSGEKKFIVKNKKTGSIESR